MSPVPAACPHDIRPGTTVCLHCRRQAKDAASARFRELAVRGGIGFAVVCVIAVAGVAGAGALRGTRIAALEPVRTAAAAAPVPVPPPDSLLTAAGVRSDSGLISVEPGTAAEVPASAASAGSAPSSAALAPSVAEGRTDLGGGVYAERHGDTVTVRFDTPASRTRRPEKFASVVRATLPHVFGGTGVVLASATAAVFDRPVTELSDAAAPIRLGGGRMSVWGETRQGQDGPLVVGYRAVITH